MPKFCHECGKKLEIQDAKFCPECGTSFIHQGTSPSVVPPQANASQSITKPPSGETVLEKQSQANIEPDDQFSSEKVEEENIDPVLSYSINQLGKQFEEKIEQLFKGYGYNTQRNQRFGQKTSRHYEIDVIAQKNNDKIAIECKNYSKPVGIKEINHFFEKLKYLDEDTNQRWRGVFISFGNLSNDARSEAERKDIDTWERDEIIEKWALFSFGRTSIKGQELKLESALAINTDFSKATAFNLINKEKITVTDATLIFHPYLRIPYRFETKFTDPARTVHEFSDKGTVVIDMLDGSVLNPPLVRDVATGLSKIITVVGGSKKGEENRRMKKILAEVTEYQPSLSYSLTIGQDYRASKLNRVVSIKHGINAALDFIIERNTRSVVYTSEKKNDPFRGKLGRVEFVPKRNKISLAGRDIIYVPKWVIHFSSHGTIYSREVFAHSGTILEDTIQYCPNHVSLGVVSDILKKGPTTIAVCEVCGRAYCENHIIQCPVCNKWLCQDHSVACSSCNKRFCTDDVPQLCQNCQLPLCSNCTVECPMCSKIVGTSHLHKCDSCGVTGCEHCIKQVGLLKKKWTCKACYEKPK